MGPYTKEYYRPMDCWYIADTDGTFIASTETETMADVLLLHLRGELPQPLSGSELATVLASLRWFQKEYPDGGDGHGFEKKHWCPEYFQEYPPLTDTEIDELCERLNT